MKGVIYARYSSDNQREESIEGQLRECKDYAERNGITILGTYIDRALSAKTDNRPEFQKMIKDSAKGLFDVVLVWKLDRFARNRYDSARYKNLLKKNGVKVISARENISEGSEGIILEAMLEGLPRQKRFYTVKRISSENTDRIGRSGFEHPGSTAGDIIQFSGDLQNLFPGLFGNPAAGRPPQIPYKTELSTAQSG